MQHNSQYKADQKVSLKLRHMLSIASKVDKGRDDDSDSESSPDDELPPLVDFDD